VKEFRVTFRPQAEADLFGLYEYVAARTDAATAAGFTDRIEATCLNLATFPKRGVRRDDIRRGLRIMGFERRAAIVFQVLKNEVVIVRIFYAGRDYERLLRGSDK
jgi:toxin ParE1/3/4